MLRLFFLDDFILFIAYSAPAAFFSACLIARATRGLGCFLLLFVRSRLGRLIRIVLYAEAADSGEHRAGAQTVPPMYVHCPLFLLLFGRSRFDVRVENDLFSPRIFQHCIG